MLARGKSDLAVVQANGFSHAGFDGPVEAGAPIGGAIAHAVLCAFEFAGCGAAVVQLDGRLLGLNQRARAYLGDGLILSHGYLSARQREGNNALQALLARVGTPRHGDSASGCSGEIALPRSEGRPLVAYAIPWSGIAGDHPQPPRALLLVIDPNEPCEPAPDLLRQMFGFTSAEFASREAVAPRSRSGRDRCLFRSRRGHDPNSDEISLAKDEHAPAIGTRSALGADCPIEHIGGKPKREKRGVAVFL